MGRVAYRPFLLGAVRPLLVLTRGVVARVPPVDALVTLLVLVTLRRLVKLLAAVQVAPPKIPLPRSIHVRTVAQSLLYGPVALVVVPVAALGLYPGLGREPP